MITGTTLDRFGVKWTKMNSILSPRVNGNFALVKDTVEDTLLLISLKSLYVVMSDSIQEMELCSEFIKAAHGDVLSLGFGMGFVLPPLISKPEVNSVTVIEIENEILELIYSQLAPIEKTRVILDDAVLWKPDMAFDVIWEDCDYDFEWTHEKLVSTGFPSNRVRLEKYLKPGGIYLSWEHHEQFRA